MHTTARIRLQPKSPFRSHRIHGQLSTAGSVHDTRTVSLTGSSQISILFPTQTFVGVSLQPPFQLIFCQLPSGLRTPLRNHTIYSQWGCIPDSRYFFFWGGGNAPAPCRTGSEPLSCGYRSQLGLPSSSLTLQPSSCSLRSRRPITVDGLALVECESWSYSTSVPVL